MLDRPPPLRQVPKSRKSRDSIPDSCILLRVPSLPTSYSAATIDSSVLLPTANRAGWTIPYGIPRLRKVKSKDLTPVTAACCGADGVTRDASEEQDAGAAGTPLAAPDSCRPNCPVVPGSRGPRGGVFADPWNLRPGTRNRSASPRAPTPAMLRAGSAMLRNVNMA